jgi:uncharacterized damage-inducible protein DinB
MSATGERLADRFLAHRSVTQALAAQIPDACADFRPWPGAMTVVDLLNHMAAAHRLFVGIAKGRGVQRPDPAALPRDLPSVRRLLAEWTEQDAADMRSLDEASLAAEVAGLRDRVMPAAAWLDAAREHEVHHKGQLFVYARMNGVEPPAWVRRD